MKKRRSKSDQKRPEMTKKKKEIEQSEPPNPTADGDILAGLDEKAVAVLQEVRRHPGMSMVKIAANLNMNRHVVADRIRDPRFQRALHEITLKATQLLDRYAPDAARRLGQEIQSEDSKLAVRASSVMLRHHLGLNINLGAQEPRPPEGIAEYDSKELMKQWIKLLIAKQARDATADS